jgi:hypothetical protein
MLLRLLSSLLHEFLSPALHRGPDSLSFLASPFNLRAIHNLQVGPLHPNLHSVQRMRRENGNERLARSQAGSGLGYGYQEHQTV